jgi:Na+/H+-dicarboxylate symporter
MTNFMHVFNTNKVLQVVLVSLLVDTHLGIKRESPSHIR